MKNLFKKLPHYENFMIVMKESISFLISIKDYIFAWVNVFALTLIFFKQLNLSKLNILSSLISYHCIINSFVIYFFSKILTTFYF